MMRESPSNLRRRSRCRTRRARACRRNPVKRRQDPETSAEWQQAADAAEAFIHLESARKYGLVSGGPVVDIEHCEQILRQAKRRGIVPAKDCVERLVKELP